MKKLWILRHFKDILVDIALMLLVVISIGVAALFIWISTIEIPDLSAFEERRILQSTKIYDRTGEILLYDLHQDVRRTIVPFESISRHIKNATVAIEDDQFYNHFGIDIRAIIRAALANMSQGDLLGGQGGSTITQQVIKNSLLDTDKKLTRKVKEAILSIKLEQILTKDEILWHYLNESPYGGTIYGVEEASQSFFGKTASEISLAEAAYLAAIPQAPTRLSPYGNNRDQLEQRKNLVLERMLINNFISSDEYEEAKATEVEFQPQAVTGIRAPHFVMFVKEQLVDKYGEETLAERGFRVITTLDCELQKEADKNILLTKKVKTGELRFGNDGFGEEGSVANLTIEQGEKYKEIRSKNLPSLELQAELTAAGLDQEVYNALGNEPGEAIDDQLSNQMIANFSSLKGLDYKKEEYSQVKEIINIDRTKGIPLIATLYKIGEHTNPNNPGGPWTEDGLPLPPKKGKDGVPLYFTNEDQFDLKLNIAKDLSFGVNKGAYKYINPGDGSDPFVRYTKSDGSTFKMTQEELSRSIERTGGAFIGTTSVENYNKYLDGLKSVASINFKGVAETYKKASEGEDNKVTATRKIRNLNKAKKDLRKFVDEQVETNGLGTTSYTGNIVQNNWQLMGGPIEAKPGDPKPTGGVYTLEDIKNSYQWNRKSYAQKEIAKEKLYNDMYAKYMADENISFS